VLLGFAVQINTLGDMKEGWWVWEGWGGARDYCPFAMVVGIERLGATGGASPLPYKKWVG